MKRLSIVKFIPSHYLKVVSFASTVVFCLTQISNAEDIPAPKDVAAAPEDASRTDSGLASKVLKPGTGTDHPGARDTVEVHYTGWDKTGKMFDSSVARGESISFPLDQVIKGWTEGVQLMVEGEKRRLWIPAKLAYGETPQRPGAPAGDLVFDIELISIKKAPIMPKTPEHLENAPEDAEATQSGLKSKILTPGTGTEKPGAADVVKVHYTGWDKTGKMFDSSVMRGEPTSFGLDQVIPGWTEGVQLMVAGEKRRFWIPAKLAYGETPQRPGAPAGDLIFDIELLELNKIPKTPADFANPPADATALENGIKSKIIKAGEGKHPQETDIAKLIFTAWDIEGNIFESSIYGGAPADIPISQVPKEMQAVMLLMKVGETRRVWVPSKHIVGENPPKGAPKGPFCFEFELVELISSAGETTTKEED